MASDVLLIPDRGEIRWIDETVSPQSMSLLGNSQNQLNFVGYTSAFDATQTPTGGTTRVTINDSSTATLVPGASGYELGSSALRWSLSATAISATGDVTFVGEPGNSVVWSTHTSQLNVNGDSITIGQNESESIALGHSYITGGVGGRIYGSGEENGGLEIASVSNIQIVTGATGGIEIYPRATGAGGTGELRFRELNSQRYYIALKSSDSLTSSVIYVFPSDHPVSNQVLTASSVSGTGPYTVTLGWTSLSGGGITSLGGQTGTTQTFANDTNVTITSSANTHTLGWTGQLAVSRGGTGAGTFTTNGVLLGNGTSAIGVTAAGTANQVLRVPGAGGAPAFGAIDLAQSAAVTGILPVANGGTGTSTAFTTGSVVFAGASGVYSQDNANYFWDNTNKRLGIGNATPQLPVDIRLGASGLLRAVNTNYPGLSEGATLILSQANDGLVMNGNRLGGILIGGASGTNYVTQNNAVAIQGYAAQRWTFGSVQGSYLTFETTPLGSATRTERMRIDPDATVWIGNGTLSAAPEAAIISATRGQGTNIAGANLTIRSGAGTGTGSSGQLIFQTATAGSSGTVPNAYSNRMTIASNGNITLVGTPGNVVWTASTGKLNIDGNSDLDHVTISQGRVESIALGHSIISGSLGGRIYGSGKDGGGLEIASISNIQVVTGASGGLEMYPRGTSAGGTGELRFLELAANGTHHIALKAADALANSVIYVLPSAQPVANQVLTASSVSGAGPYTVTLGWTSLSGGGITSLGGQTGTTQTFANDTNVTISSSTNVHTLGWTGQLAVARGGTGASTLTSNGVLLGNGTSAISATAAGTANQVLRVPGGGGAPAFGAIDLAQSAAVTGILGMANGGTGTSTAFTSGSVVFAGASGVYSQNNTDFSWDNSISALSLRTSSAGTNPLLTLRRDSQTSNHSGLVIRNNTVTTSNADPAQVPPSIEFFGNDWTTSGTPGNRNIRTRLSQFTNDINPGITFSQSIDTGTASYTNYASLTRYGLSLLTTNAALFFASGAFIKEDATSNYTMLMAASNGAVIQETDIGLTLAEFQTTGNKMYGGSNATVLKLINNIGGNAEFFSIWDSNDSINDNRRFSVGLISGVYAVTLYPYDALAGSTTELRFKELLANGSNHIAFKAPDSIAQNVTYILPDTQPAANQVLRAASVSGAGPYTVTLGWVNDADTGITSLGGQTGTTQTFANDTNVTITSSANTHTLGWTGQLAVSRGGTGAGTFTSNGVLLGNGTSAIGVTAAGTANQVLRIPGGGGAPAFGAIDLAQSAAVTGILGVANGGTGTSTAFTTGSVVFAGASGVYSQSNNFTYNTSTGQFAIATTGSGAGILIGGDTQLYRDAADVLRTPDSLRIDSSIAINTTVPANSRFIAAHTTTSLSTDYTTLQSTVTHTVNTPDTATNRAWAMQFTATQSGSGTFNDSATYGATGLEGGATYSGSGSSVGVTGGAFVARNTGTGTLTRANGIVIPMSSVNTGGGHITNLRPLDIAWATDFSATNQTRMAIRIGAGPTNAGSFGGSIVGGIWFNSNSGTAVDGIIWGTSADVNLYRSAANILSTDDNFEIRGGLALRMMNPANTKQSTFAAGAQTVVINYTLPTAAPALNDVLKVTSVSGTDPATVTLGWAADSGITSLGGQTGATQTFANDTNVTISSATNTHTLGWTGQLAVSRGGTGASTLTSNGVLLGNGTSAISATVAGTANQVLRVPGAGGAPAFGAIDLAQSAAVTGILPVANGGTGTSTAFTTGSVVFAGASGVYSQDNANYFWDNTNKRLGLGTASPGATLHVNPATGSQTSWLTDGAFFRVQAGTRTNSSTAISGTAASAVFASFGQPTLAATNASVTTTDAATVYIANAPAAGTNMTITNPYALWVDAGLSRFDDPIGVGINPVADTMIYGNITTSSNLTRRGVFGYNTVTGAITSTFPVGVAGRLDVNAGANTISYVAGMTGSMRTQSGQSGTVTEAYGIDFDAWHAGTSNVTSLVCSRAFSSIRNTSSGTVSTWTGYLTTLDMQSRGTNSAVINALGYDFSASLAGESTITNLIGYRVQNPTGRQTITNFYGIRINDLTRGTNNYGIYFDGTSGLARQGIWWNADTNLYRSAANTLKTDAALVVGQRISSGVVVLTDDANISLDASLGNHFRVTLGGNRTLNAPTNAVDGQRITIEVIQDSTGSRTLTLTTGSSGAFIFGTDITAITLTTTANKRDLIGCVYSSSLARWMVVSFVKGF